MARERAQPEPDAIRYGRAISRRRGTVLLTAALGVGVAAAYAFLTPPVYRASALLSVDKIAGDIAAPNDPRENPEDGYFETQVGLITSETQLQRVYRELGLAGVKEFARGVPALREAVEATPIPKTRLCYVSAESSDPGLAAAIAGSLAHAFVKKNLDNQLYESKDILAALKAHERDPKAWKMIESLPAVVDNKVINDLKGQIYDAEARLADMRTRYKDRYPDLQALESRLDALRRMRDHEMDNVVTSIKTELSGQFRANNARVIDEPVVPARPVRPRRALALAIGLGAGLALGVFLALLLETVDETVLTPQDVEQKLGFRFLSVIPRSSKRRKPSYQPLLSPEATPFGEAFRNLRTIVQLADVQGDPVLLVTSALQSEGKSFVASNLGVALSQAGEKVLVIDGDLRKPTQHLNLDCPVENGLSDYLSGALAAPDVVHATSISNLELVPSGVPSKNPGELLSGERLGEFLDWARARYRRVIVDCSPVFPVSDVLLWGRHAGRALLVARYGRTRVPLIKQACSRLRSARAEIVGGVINDARVRTMNYAEGRYFERY